MQASHWSYQEIEDCVTSYLCMLALELNGQRYSKQSYIRFLSKKLNGRSQASIQFKYRNVSAILLELGHPYIDGYKPLFHYLKLLLEVLIKILSSNTSVSTSLQESAQSAVTRPAAMDLIQDAYPVWVDTPSKIKRKSSITKLLNFSPIRCNYLAQESKNRSLGFAGELFVLNLEIKRLYNEGKKYLSDQVEHVSVSQGDGLGYDILSYEYNGQERLIEVKTTVFGSATPFYVTRNEVLRSEQNSDNYYLYRAFNFRIRPQLFKFQGAVAKNCYLDAVTYLAYT